MTETISGPESSELPGMENQTMDETPTLPIDPAGRSEHLTPEGKRKGRRRTKIAETEVLNQQEPVVRIPDELLREIRRRPMRERADIGELHNTEPKKR